MLRREFLGALVASPLAFSLPGCASRNAVVMTVKGPIDASAMGMTLAHEHLYADVRPYAEQAAHRIVPDADAVVAMLRPHLRNLKAAGCRTLVDCTATTLGRDPALIRRLSEESGLHMLTVTGAYVAAGGRFVPPYVNQEDDARLAARWIGEWRDGIDGTGVRPGLIKLGIENDPLGEIERKVLRAAARTHLESGLVIAAHTGPWGEVAPGRNARCALAQLDLLESMGLAPSAWIWVHAQNEVQGEHHLAAARRGAWVSFDGYRPGQEGQYVAMLRRMADAGLLGRVLLSQDAGWYNAGQPGGGDFKPYDPLFIALLPELRRNGFDDDAIATLMIRNPAAAFAVDVRKRYS